MAGGWRLVVAARGGAVVVGLLPWAVSQGVGDGAPGLGAHGEEVLPQGAAAAALAPLAPALLVPQRLLLQWWWWWWLLWLRLWWLRWWGGVWRMYVYMCGCTTRRMWVNMVNMH